MTSNFRLGHHSSSSPRSGAASTTCSKLSSRSMSSRSSMCSARPSLAPNVCAIASITSAGSRSVASGTQKTPALNAGTSSAAASSASRVLPEPPGPESVRSLVPFPSRPTSSSRSRRRPTKEEAGRGRLVFEIVFSGGKRSEPSWKSATGSSKSFNRCSPSSVSSPSTNARVAAETTICPPCPEAATRAARWSSRPA